MKLYANVLGITLIINKLKKRHSHSISLVIGGYFKVFLGNILGFVSLVLKNSSVY